jgi:DNA end-binding protein Ku
MAWNFQLNKKDKMARSLWTGSIAFGLVNIPVKIHSAVKESSLDLDMLDSRDHQAIKFKRVNERTGKEVKYEDIVKGYLVNDRYVVLDPEDFVNADAEKTQTIDIKSFVKESDIDSIYYEQPYYLAPDKTSARPYALLRDALALSKKVGIATFVFRNKEALAAIKAYGKVLVLNRIRFEEEIREPEEVKTPAVSRRKSAEMTMALKLIEQQTTRFTISRYKDSYTAKLMKIIRAKAKGKTTPKATLKVVHTKSSDLAEALKASLVKKRKAS